MRLDLDDVGIRRYLLGLLPEPEAEALEEEYLARPELLERVRSVESDLLDDYAAGRLEPDEKQALESRYLASRPLRDRVLAARALHLAAPVEKAPAVRIAAARRMQWGGPLAIAASLLVAVMAFWLWPSRAPLTPGSPAPTPLARSETPMRVPTGSPSVPAALAMPPGAPARTHLVFALSPGLLRAEGEPAELRIPPGTGAIALELEGDPNLLPPSPARLEAVITTIEGKRIWFGEARRVRDAARPSLLASVGLSADRLAAGDYLLTLRAGADKSTVSRYFFRSK